MCKTESTTSIIRKFLMNDEARYSITRPYEAVQISDFIISNCTKDPSQIVILDATAGVGGDTINFSKVFNCVISVENNHETYSLLCSNIEIFKRSNVYPYNDDFLNFISYFRSIIRNIDVLYIDAPWNGTSYKTKKDINLYISDVKLQELVRLIKEISPDVNIFLKVPLNICMEGFEVIEETVIQNKKGVDSFKILKTF